MSKNKGKLGNTNKQKQIKLRDASGYQALWVNTGQIAFDEKIITLEAKIPFDIILLESDQAKILFDLIESHFGFKLRDEEKGV